ncbi:hypothetical protein [Streptomyces sp. C36]|uniref:hypothetical protein n=1 Tax=Streptomyces sp. C36 TaxID=3237122 RepID=UPI0034C5DBE0
MSDQHHHNPYEPYERHDQYAPYEPYAPYDPQAADGQAPPAYDYGYDAQGQDPHHAQGQHQAPHQHQAPAQPAAPAWPQPQHGFPAHEEPDTQTWQTQSWDARAWQQQAEPAPVAEPAHDAPWAGGGTGAAAWDRPQPQAPRSQTPQPYHSTGTPAPVAEPMPVAGMPPSAAALSYPSHPELDAEPAPVADRPLTAAEKAKAEGRAQILSPGFRPALITAVLAALLAAAAPLAEAALAVPVVLLQAVTAAGWFRLNGMWPARQGIALAFLGGVVADAALLATEASKAPTVLLGTLGVWILLVIVLQLRSHASPDERLYGLTAATASAALAVVAAGHLAADPDAVVVGAAGVAAAVLARALPLPSLAAPVVALVAAAGAGIAGGQLTGMGTTGALLGLAAGVCALVGLRVASYDYPSRFVHMTAGVALPLALAAPAVYVLGRALG